MATYDSYPVVLSDDLMKVLQDNLPSELWNTIFDGLQRIVRRYEINGQGDLVEKEVLKLRDLIYLEAR